MDQDARVTGLRIERSGPVLTVAFDNPDRRNAQVPSTWHALAQVETLVDESVRVVVVRGDGADGRYRTVGAEDGCWRPAV